jgi:hypothetical protein
LDRATASTLLHQIQQRRKKETATLQREWVSAETELKTFKEGELPRILGAQLSWDIILESHRPQV